MHIDQAIKWYTNNRITYEALSRKTSEIIKEVLDNEKIEYYSITWRAKKIDSFTRKIKNEKYDVPEDITDLAGIRIITYVESEANKAAKFLQKLFDIDLEKIVDKSTVLGVDKVGYRSQHYIASFSSDRSKLPEFKKFSGLKFEVQIRTILEHAWNGKWKILEIGDNILTSYGVNLNELAEKYGLTLLPPGLLM